MTASRPTIPVLWRLHPEVIAGAAWGWVSVAMVRRRLRRDGIRAAAPRPLLQSPHARRGLDGVLKRLAPTCIERALIIQRWAASQGRPVDVVVGVPASRMGADEPAHAWIDGGEPASTERYAELLRLGPPDPATGRPQVRPPTGLSPS